ncbi:MAG TPA: hypothetical protein DIT25_00165 [Candidatus Moranbacteria bacterium]|nr:hypothetical protein [Candidatus Moranbacteria bacterium]
MEKEEIIIDNDNAAEADGSIRPRRPYKRLPVFVLVGVMILSSIFGAIFGFMAGGISQKIYPGLYEDISNLPKAKDIIRQRVVEEDSAVIDVVEKTSPSVVSIAIIKNIPGGQDSLQPFDFPGFFGLPFGGEDESRQVGGGTGFFVSSDGMIVTNKHVVDDTSAEYVVITNEGKEFNARVMAKDPINDIAIVKIEGNNFSTLNLGDSDALKIGQTAIAIGNSLGEFSNTVSKGIISGLQRNVVAGGSGGSEQLRNIIQTDAAINPGNSGGPLLDINGDVIGVNVAMAQGAQNIGFAIPSNQLKKAVDQVKSTGKISLPYLGVRYIPIDNSIQKENNLPYAHGALVLRGQKMTDFAVIPGSPADRAGISENDIILEVENAKIDQANNLADLISKYKIGDTVTLKIWHRGEEKNVKVTLGEAK